MPIVVIIIAIAAVGFLVYAVEKWVPMDPVFKRILQVVAIVCLIVFLLREAGLWNAVMGARI